MHQVPTTRRVKRLFYVGAGVAPVVIALALAPAAGLPLSDIAWAGLIGFTIAVVGLLASIGMFVGRYPEKPWGAGLLVASVALLLVASAVIRQQFDN